MLHEPAILILDEPTSGVDPIARDAFWRTLIDLVARRRRDDFRHHPFHERGRALRPHLAHARRQGARGRRAAGAGQGARQRVRSRTASSAISRKPAGHRPPQDAEAPAPVTPPKPRRPRAPKRFNPGRLWAYARRETVELLRDPIRLAFALLGPIILMLAFGFGISFDIENLPYAAFDQDETPQSRELLQGFSTARAISPSSRRSRRRSEAERRLKSGEPRSSSKSRPASAATS